MMRDDYNQRVFRGAATKVAARDEGLRAYMLKVYNYMTLGLGLTGVVSYLVGTNPTLMNFIFQTPILPWIVMLAPLGLVLFLSFRIQTMSASAAQTTFWIYAALMGLSVSFIFIAYTGESIARTFFVTAGTFGAMSLYGYTTRRDLTGFGSFLIMGLIGVIIASLVNLFLASPGLSFVTSILAVLIFTGLTAYDTQRIKASYFEGDMGDVAEKKAIFGALQLYLDFINLFLNLLRLFGDRR
jgi:FtsH-binding integral membrane protein